MTMTRLAEKFQGEIAPALAQRFGYGTPMAVPRIKKIVLNMGVGEASADAKLLDQAVEELAVIAGQRPAITRARKSIANFKLREGMPIGARVTLRGSRMWYFLDRLVNVVLPRVRDFRGVSPKAFDGRGNYTLGLQDQLVFPEIDMSKVDLNKGMNVTLVTTADRDDQARLMMEKLGFPFVRPQDAR